MICAGPVLDMSCGIPECRPGIYPGLEDQLVECALCEGTGMADDDICLCPDCAGRGKVLVPACEACGLEDGV